MNSLANQSAAAVAAFFLTVVSMSAIVNVPPVQAQASDAAMTGAPELA